MKKKISVFIASPGDLSNERSLFRDAINQLNEGFGDGAGVEFEALGWEDTLASTGRRNQGVINEEIDKCDVFILAMDRRWGQDAPDAEPYSSYTEEEFHRALERFKKERKPEVFVFFKRVDAVSEGDPGPQLKQVMDFRKQLEDTRKVLYHYFEDDESFVKEVDRHLRAYAKGELPKTDREKDLVVLPASALKEIKREKAIATQKTEEAEKAHDLTNAARLKLEQIQLQMAEDAAILSKEGKIEFARQKFSTLVVESTNLRILSLSYEFYYRTGDLNAALSVLKKWLSLSGENEKTVDTAKALINLGNLYHTRGKIDCADEMYQKSLAINKALGCKEGMASNYGNLGNLYRIRGELERAEEMFHKSFEINEELGRKEGMANQYCNLGILYRTRGELECAEEMFHKSFEINEELGCKEGMSNQYGNLGNLYRTRGELKRAEKMYQKSLVIERALGRKEGMARDYCNLGSLQRIRGELDRAEEMYQKSLLLFKEIESPQATKVEEFLNELSD